MTLPFFKSCKTIVVSLVFLTLSLNANASLTFSNLIIFGDSLSDTGNVAQSTGNLLGGPAGYGNNGRFSNGPLWHEYMAAGLGLSSTHSLSGGNNFAYGGAEIDNAGGISVGVLTQYEQYKNRIGADPFDADALYVAWAGGNDMRGLVGDADPLNAITNIMEGFRIMLTDMVVRGANTLLVPNLPNLGAIPEFRTSANATSAAFVSSSWNQLLEQTLIDIAKTYLVDIYLFDVFSIFDEILANPAAEGFTNTTGQCRSLFLGFIERSCAQADSYVFWDQIHPTTAAHSVLGREALLLLQSGQTVYQQVPAPVTLLLFVSGLVILARRYQALAFKR
jgi:outer membrane lipase/esterase